MKARDYYIHESSFVDDNDVIGDGTKIWHFFTYNQEQELDQTVFWDKMLT